MQEPPHATGASGGGRYAKLRFALGTKAELNLGLSAQVADAKRSETRNSPVESCYEHPPALVDDGFYLVSVSNIFK
jgi:hypothetical protein